MPMHSFKLFVTGDTPRARNATRALRALCEAKLTKDYEIDVVDVLERPEEAEEHRIIVTPAVLKMRPPPPRRAIGDLAEAERVVKALELQFDVENASG